MKLNGYVVEYSYILHYVRSVPYIYFDDITVISDHTLLRRSFLSSCRPESG